MNYDAYLTRFNFEIDSLALKEMIVFSTNHEPFIISDYNGSYQFEELCYYVANYVNRNNYGTTIAFMVQADNGLYLLNSNYIDFCELYYESSLNLSMGRPYPNDTDIRDGTEPTNYLNTNTSTTYESFTYGAYNRSIADNYALFDYSNLKYENTSYYLDTLAIRGENISFYMNYLVINNNGSGFYSYGYGRPYAQMRADEYQRGYSAGYGSGYVQGKDDGYIIGFNSNGGTPETANAFSYIGNAFEVVSNVMALEILPHVTLGLAFSIPLVFTLIMVVFKLVRK